MLTFAASPISRIVLFAIDGDHLGPFSICCADSRGGRRDRLLVGPASSGLRTKRKSCAQAIADALQWLELPYRIRRRPNDAAETLSSLAERTNNLREQQEFHEKWLRIEMPGSAQKYGRLVKEVRAAAGTAIADAWRTGPVKSAGDMNIGELDISRGRVEQAVEEFSSAVVKELSWWRVRF